MDENEKKHAFQMELALNLGISTALLVKQAKLDKRDSIPLTELEQLLLKTFLDMSKPDTFYAHIDDVQVQQTLHNLRGMSTNN
jgi:hypothetical protein